MSLVHRRGGPAMLIRRTRGVVEPVTGREMDGVVTETEIVAIVASRAVTEDASPGGSERTRTWAYVLPEAVDTVDATAEDVRLRTESGTTYKVVEIEPERLGSRRVWLEADE